MKDIHNHILYGIDDGSISYLDSIRILKELEQEKIHDILLTPHYIIGSEYNANNKKKQELLKTLKNKTSINLYIGNEVYIDNDIIDYIKKGMISTINNTRYLLIELPLNEKLEIMYDIIFELRSYGIIPIVAHPERYHYLKLDDLITLINQGCLLQGNITSLNNKYGKKAKDNLILLLKKNMIHVLGTDTHRNGKINLKEALDTLKKLVDVEIYKDLTYRNFDKIINDIDINTYEIVNTSNIFKKEKLK
ncbi:MAG: hypothetical protein IJZ36_05290 [Bacilli bacterium]|nr:hypothetical protein [Bacilli bacterium]